MVTAKYEHKCSNVEHGSGLGEGLDEKSGDNCDKEDRHQEYFIWFEIGHQWDKNALTFVKNIKKYQVLTSNGSKV